jgi:hypothetical protein
MFPNLFAMCQQHDLTVFQFKSYPHLITFTRWLVDIWKESWDNILVDASQVQLCECDDIITLKFGGHGCFTMKSVYNALTSNDSGPYHKKVWKSKIPAKIKIFLWLVMNNAILTKDNMIKQNWQMTHLVIFVTKLKQSIICYFNAVLLKPSELSLL